MKKEFTPRFIKDPKVKTETLEIEVTDTQVIFLMDKNLIDGRHIYNNIVIDKAEIKEFLEEALG